MKGYLISILISLLALTGCKPKQIELSGQVFIVTQGADNVKLGDVRVLLIEKSQVADLLKKKQTTIEADIINRKQEVDDAEKKAAIAQADYESFRSGNLTNQVKLYELGDNSIRADSLVKNAKKRLEDFPTSEDYLSNFSPVASQETRTDADGKYSFIYTCEKSFTIFASGQRMVLNKTEKYYWLVDAPTNGESVQVVLSNNNLVEVDPDGYLALKPKDTIRDSSAQ